MKKKLSFIIVTILLLSSISVYAAAPSSNGIKDQVKDQTQDQTQDQTPDQTQDKAQIQSQDKDKTQIKDKDQVMDQDQIFKDDGVNMFPLRTVSSALKATLQWDQNSKMTVMIVGGKTIKFKAGENMALVNNKNITMDHPALLKKGRIYISEMAMKDIWGIEVEYVDGRAIMTIVIEKDLVSTIGELGNFKTLESALKAGGLEDTLKGEGPFTLFAPTDAAFAKLSKGTLEDLLKPENKDKLIDILKYHVASGKLLASDVIELDKIEMLNEKDADIEIKGSNVLIDGANISLIDIKTSNGVIHVIDDVMIP